MESNNFAISQQAVGDILERSSAAMREANNSLSETIALGTGAQEVQQDSRRVGTALRTVSMRIRGVSEDTGELTGKLPTLEREFEDIGLTLRKDENTFKSTYEIISDLAEVWDDLEDMERADILKIRAL